MKEDNNDIFDGGQEVSIDLGKFWRRLKRHWKRILVWTLSAFVLGCAIALMTPHKFVSYAKLAHEMSATTSTKLSAAALMGLSSSALGSTDAIYPMVYPDIVASPQFEADLFLMPVELYEDGDTTRTTLYDYMVNYREKSIIREIAGAPGRLVDWVKGLFVPAEEWEEVEGCENVDPSCFTKEQAGVVKALSKCIEVEVEKKTLSITVAVTFDDRYLGTRLCEYVVEKLKEYIIRYRTGKAEQNLEYCQKINDQTEAEYMKAQSRYANYADSHFGIATNREMAEKERLKNDASLKFQLYTSAAQSLQAAQAKVQQERPVFAEIITPTVPFRSADSRKKVALAFAFLGFCLGCCVVLVKFRKEDENEAETEEGAE